MEKKENNPEHIESPNWIRPDLSNESGEIERVTGGFLGKELNEENLKEVITAIQNSPAVDLTEEEWAILENTDSFHAIRPGHPEDAEKITEKINSSLPAENRRIFKNVLEGFVLGKDMEMPVIIKNKEGRLHLLSGNTRLMIARALKIRPRVVIAYLS